MKKQNMFYLIKSGRSFITAWAPLQIRRKYFVLTSETIPFIFSTPFLFWNKVAFDVIRKLVWLTQNHEFQICIVGKIEEKVQAIK